MDKDDLLIATLLERVRQLKNTPFSPALSALAEVRISELEQAAARIRELRVALDRFSFQETNPSLRS